MPHSDPLRELSEPASATFCACSIYALEDDIVDIKCWTCGQVVAPVGAAGERVIDHMQNKLAGALNERDIALVSLAALTPHNPNQGAA